MASENLRGSLWMVASMAGFAVEDAFLKSASAHLPVGEVMIALGVLGILVFGALTLHAGQPMFPAAIVSRTMVIRSAFEVVGRLFYALAIALTPISVASAILQASPLVVVLGAALVFGERVGALRWVVIGLGFIGVLIILRPGMAGFDVLSLLAVTGLIGFAGRDLATRAAPPALSNAQLGVAGFTMLGLAGVIILGFTGGAVIPPVPVVAMVAGASVFGIGGYAALTKAMRTGEVSAVTPFRYSRLLFAMILGVLAFGERPDVATLAGSAIIVGCGLIILTQRRRLTSHLA
ncbi:MAG: DMT family transporter [Paracoccaceae bacterium]